MHDQPDGPRQGASDLILALCLSWIFFFLVIVAVALGEPSREGLTLVWFLFATLAMGFRYYPDWVAYRAGRDDNTEED